MTCIVGFVKHKSIFLVSDTALTVENSKSNGIPSSFGEAVHVNNDSVVFQSEIKLFSLANGKLVVGGAGNSHSIDSFVQNLETYQSYDFSIAKCLESAIENIENNDFELLIGCVNDKSPVLYKKENNSIVLKICNSDFSSIGKAGTHFKMFKSNFNEIKKQTDNFINWESERIMVTINSIFQAYSIWHYTLPEGVGGVFTSLYLNKIGVVWQPSIAYVTFDIDFDKLKSIKKEPQNVLPNNLFTNSNYVFVTQREGLFFIASPKPNFSGFLFRNLDFKKGNFVAEWFNKYENSIHTQYENIDIDYVVFICSNTRVITIIKKSEIDEIGIQIKYGEKLELKYEIIKQEDIHTYAGFINRISQPLDNDFTINV